MKYIEKIKSKHFPGKTISQYMIKATTNVRLFEDEQQRAGNPNIEYLVGAQAVL